MLNQVSLIDLSRPPALAFPRHGPMQGRMARIGAVVGPTNFVEAAGIGQEDVVFSCRLLVASY